MAIKIFIKKSDVMIVANCQLLVIPATPFWTLHITIAQIHCATAQWYSTTTTERGKMCQQKDLVPGPGWGTVASNHSLVAETFSAANH